MKIILTVHQFLPKHAAGTETLTYQVAKELMHRGHEVIVVTGHHCNQDLAPEERFDEYIYDDIQVLRYHHGYVAFGGQTAPNEIEYNSFFVGNWFEGILRKRKPDLVHIFHLGLLSASVIDACEKVSIPKIMTTTDFWLVCLTNQLRLPDGSLCQGPNLNSLNCIRHIVETGHPEHIKQRLRSIPDWAMHIILLLLKKDLLPQRWFTQAAKLL